MKFDISTNSSQAALRDKMIDNNILTGDNVFNVVMGLWAWYLHDYKSFKKPICITNGVTTRSTSLTNCCTNLHITYFRNPDQEPCYINGEEIKVQDNKILSYFLSNASNHKIDVVMDDIKNPNYTRINVDRNSTNKRVNEVTLISAIISIFPKIFTEIKTNDDNVMLLKSLLKNMSKGNDEDLLDYTNKIMNDKLTAILSSKFSQYLKQCIKHSREKQIKVITKEIENIMNEANQLLSRYDALMNQKSDYDQEIISLNASSGQNIDETEKMLSDLLLNNPSIRDVCIYDEVIQYKVMTHLNYYDEELFETVTAPPNGGTIEDVSILASVDNCTREEMYDLLIQIFKQRKYSIRVYGGFKLGFNYNNESLHNMPFAQQVIDNHVPSPHGQLFNCVGTFKRQWEEAIKTGDIYMAVSYTIAFTQNLNWADFTVTRAMINSLSHMWWNEKILEDVNGNLFTPCRVITERRKNSGKKAN